MDRGYVMYTWNDSTYRGYVRAELRTDNCSLLVHPAEGKSRSAIVYVTNFLERKCMRLLFAADGLTVRLYEDTDDCVLPEFVMQSEFAGIPDRRKLQSVAVYVGENWTQFVSKLQQSGDWLSHVLGGE